MKKLGGYGALEGILNLDFEKLPMLSYNKYLLQNMFKIQTIASNEITRIINHPLLHSKIIGIGKKRNYQDHARTLAKIGVYQVGQLLNAKGSLQMSEGIQKGGMSCKMAYAAVKNAIPAKWKTVIQSCQKEIAEAKLNQQNKDRANTYYSIQGENGAINAESKQKDITRWINNRKENKEPVFVKKMKQLYEITDEEWKQINIKAVQFANYEKMKSFLYRL